MEFLVVGLALDIPAGTPKSEISDRENAEAAATAKLADEGHLVRVWRSGAQGESTIIGLYRADSEAQLDGLLGALPLADIESHPGLLNRNAQTLMVYQKGGTDFRITRPDRPMLPCRSSST